MIYKKKSGYPLQKKWGFPQFFFFGNTKKKMVEGILGNPCSLIFMSNQIKIFVRHWHFFFSFWLSVHHGAGHGSVHRTGIIGWLGRPARVTFDGIWKKKSFLSDQKKNETNEVIRCIISGSLLSSGCGSHRRTSTDFPLACFCSFFLSLFSLYCDDDDGESEYVDRTTPHYHHRHLSWGGRDMGVSRHFIIVILPSPPSSYSFDQTPFVILG